MKSPTLPLHKAQVERLQAQTPYKIFDDNPENETYPYVVMGETFAKDWSDKSKPGQEVTSKIHIWSQYPGRKEADEMSDDILQALTANTLDLSPDFRITVGKMDSWLLILDIDGVTRHGVLEMRYLIEEL